MEISVDVKDEVLGTPHFDFVYGRFQLSSWSIPYFCTTMNPSDAAQSLKLVREFPGWEDNNWTLEELFQREVDWKRVSHRIVPYLKNRDHPQFFNSITVALLPQLNGEVVPYDTPGLSAPPLVKELGTMRKEVTAGPLRVGYWGDWDHLGQRMARFGTLRWNPKQTFGVAIDGQHRLAALKELASSRSDDTLVPIIILVFDPSLGYESPSPDDNIIPLLRSLFIDLNKHSVKVSRSRLILLDDRDPTAVCVRALVGDRLTDDLGDLSGAPPQLPLSLIDWHSDSAKFASGPYIGTILGIDWMVQRALGIRPVHDFTDYSKVRSQLRAIKRMLGVDLPQARRRLGECQETQRPFNYDDGSIDGQDELGLVSRAFKEQWNPAIVHLLTKFRPYQRLIRIRDEARTTNATFVQWYQLHSQIQDGGAEKQIRDAYEDLKTRLNDGDVSAMEYERRLTIVEDEKGGSLAFNVVFQRALFLAFSDYQTLQDEDVGLGLDGSRHLTGHEGIDPDEDELDSFYADFEEGHHQAMLEESSQLTDPETNRIERRSHEFVEALNALVDCWPEFLDPRASCSFVASDRSAQFWLGTLWKAEQSIDFTQGASGRAKALINWAVGLWILREAGEIDSSLAFETFWRELVRERIRDGAIHRFVRKATTEFHRQVGASKSTAARIVGIDDATQEQLEAVAVVRFGQIYEALVQ